MAQSGTDSAANRAGLPEGTAVYGFSDGAQQARALASALSVGCHIAELHRFPDGESLVRLPNAPRHAILYRPMASIDGAGRSDVRNMGGCNSKLIEILLAASALREHGAETVTLVAPYLPYLRQDTVFRPGEPISQKVVGGLLSSAFDRLLTVNPHMHRTRSPEGVFPGCFLHAVSAAPEMAASLAAGGLPENALILAADQQVDGLAADIAGFLGRESAIARKERHGMRLVSVELPDEVGFAGRDVVIVDDAVSTGATMIACYTRLKEAGANNVSMMTVHALFSPEAGAAFLRAGLNAVSSCDGIPHPSNRVSLARLLARTLCGDNRDPEPGA